MDPLKIELTLFPAPFRMTERVSHMIVVTFALFHLCVEPAAQMLGDNPLRWLAWLRLGVVCHAVSETPFLR
jgi:hypothetical protein